MPMARCGRKAVLSSEALSHDRTGFLPMIVGYCNVRLKADAITEVRRETSLTPFCLRFIHQANSGRTGKLKAFFKLGLVL